METKNSDFQFKSYWIKKSVIELKQRLITNANFTMDIDPSGFKSEKDVVLTLEVNIKEKNDLLNICVIIEGSFELKEDLSLKEINNYFYTNAPAILFPYIRAYISTLTVQAGIHPIVIPTLNMQNIGKELAKKISLKK